MSAPVADFTFTPPNGFSPLVVQFTDLSTGAPTQWLWKFDNGDGTFATSTDQNPSHTFTAPPYLWRSVELDVQNADGQSSKKQGPFPGGVYLQIHNQ